MLLALPAICKAANNCPWLNEATASGILGGEAVGVLTGIGAGETAVCEFTQQGTNFKRILRVTVEVAPDFHARQEALARSCGGDAVPLKAIGNEALICSANDPKNGQGERVVGRVRDQLFTIAIYTTLKGDPILTREALKARIGTAAEQIAGNLF
jgi:hypothetical protein